MDVPEEKLEPKKHIKYADDDRDPVRVLALMRIPPLVIGLILGLGLSFITSRFEEVLTANVQIAFFIPFVVYMAAAVGEQTQSIYIRDLKSGKAKFTTYLIKETILGFILGAFFGLISWFVVEMWFGSAGIARAVSLSTFAAIAAAPLIALVVTEILELEHRDPAVGAGPIATVIQDTVSVVIYGIISSAILLN